MLEPRSRPSPCGFRALTDGVSGRSVSGGSCLARGRPNRSEAELSQESLGTLRVVNAILVVLAAREEGHLL